MDERTLISNVRKYPLLYDLSSPLYLDQQKKDEAWNEISMLMSASAYDCKIKWTRLRDNYRKALMLRKKKNFVSNNRPLKYDKELSFLDKKFSFTPKNKIKTAADFNEIVESYTNDSDQESQEPKTNLTKVFAAESTSKQGTVSNKASKKHMAASKPVHEINTFFEGIAETVKTFPKKLQVQLKRAVFNLVNDAETSLLENEDANHSILSAISTPVLTINEHGVIGTVQASNEIYGSEYDTTSILSSQSSTCDSAVPVQFCNAQIKEESIFDIKIDGED